MRISILGKTVFEITKSWDQLLSTDFDEFFGRTVRKHRTIKSDSQALKSNRGVVYDCTNLIGNRISSTELEFYYEKDGEDVPLTEDQFKFIRVWNNPNPLFSRRAMKKVVQIHQELTGEGYIYKARNMSGMVEQLWPIIPTEINLKYERGEYYFEHQTVSGKERYPLNDVIYLRDANVTSMLNGYSPLQAKGVEYDINAEIKRYHLDLFESDAWFPYALSTDQTVTKPQADMIKAGWVESRKEGRNTPPVLQKGLSLTQLKQSALDLGVQDVTNQTRDDILMAFSIHISMLGKSEGILRANLDAIETQFAKNVLLPRLDTWKDGIQPTITELDPRVKIRFKNIVPKDKEAILKETETMIRNGLLSIEEGRERHGYNPDFRPGDTVLVPINMFPATTGGNGQRAIDVTPIKSLPKKKEWDQERKDAYQKKFEMDTEAREKRWLPQIKKWVSVWEKEALRYAREELKAASDKYNGWGVARVRADYKESITKQPDTTRIEELILTSAGKLHRLDFQEAGEEAIAFVGVDITFNMDAPEIVRYLGEKTRNFASEQTRRMANELESILRTGVTDGQTIIEITDKIKEVMEWESEGYRAARVARTEVISASNRARTEGFTQAGVKRRSWSSSRDMNVRDTHLDADARTSSNPIGINEDFVLSSGARGPEPGSMSEAGENINCRCTTRPELEE